MTQPEKRGPGRPPTGVTPKRNIRVGAVWDEAETIAAKHGETMTNLVKRLLDNYVRRHRGARSAQTKQQDQRDESGVNKFAAFRTVDDAAAAATEMLTAGEHLSAIWRLAILQLLDDYRSVLAHEGPAAAERMWRDEPRRTGDTRVNAALAALGEHLARRDGWSTPAWTALNPDREAAPWWFVTELRGMHPRALVESPSSFRRRGVFIGNDALERV